ncbi:hypothetical protein ACMD2_27157 [Ananas comosus]|uniref:Uncharacterized protein n=1 Tax=Ananas comosus TaxID=4615 RepID=A0A199UTP6_ANACO|nr:hypothetical protein ACMD2_27157 [Ananas comosus]
MPSPWCLRPVRRNAEVIMGLSAGIGEVGRGARDGSEYGGGGHQNTSSFMLRLSEFESWKV